EHLRAMLAKLRRQRYGRSSEKLEAAIDQLELTLEDAEVAQAQAEAKVAEAGPARGRASSLPHGGPAGLQCATRAPILSRARSSSSSQSSPVAAMTHPAALKIREKVTEVLEKIPSQLKIIRYIRPIYACRACEMVTQAPAPDLPILKGRAGPNLIAHIA